MKKIAIALTVIFVAFMILQIVVLAETKKITVVVFNKEKTVFLDNEEVKGVVQFNYEIKKNATITTSSTETPLLSYKGALITGKITLSAPSALLDKALKEKRSVKLKYAHNKDKKLTEYDFPGSMIEKADVEKKKGKVTKAVYSFRATSVIETKR